MNKVSMDGKDLTDGIIPLFDDGQTHEVVVISEFRINRKSINLY